MVISFTLNIAFLFALFIKVNFHIPRSVLYEEVMKCLTVLFLREAVRHRGVDVQIIFTIEGKKLPRESEVNFAQQFEEI